MIEPIQETFTYNELRHANPKNHNTVVVNWCLGSTCNFSCSYCPDGLHNGKQPWPSLDTAIQFIEHVKASRPEKNIYVELTGGEVTIWKDLIPFAEHCRKSGIKIGIISNGSRSIDYWNKLLPKIDHVCLSFHPEKGNPEHYFEVVKLASSLVRTHTNFMMMPERFNEVLALAFKVKELPNLSMALQPLVIDFKDTMYKYTPTQMKVLDRQYQMLSSHIKHEKTFEFFRGAMEMVGDNKSEKISPHRLISSGLNNWKGWTCYAGVEQMVVDMKGSVLRGWCLVGGKIGHISDTKMKLSDKPIVCNKSFCHCNFDIMSTKIREKKERDA